MASDRIVMISQPRYLPAANYLHRMSLADICIYLDTVQYSPKYWENRNKIKTKQGPMWLSVPVVSTSRAQLVKDTRIDRAQRWGQKHWQSIRHSYARSRHFEQYATFFEAIYRDEWEYLSDLNHKVISFLTDELQISCQFRWAHEFEIETRGPGLLVELCRAVGGTVYVSGPWGREYIDVSSFEEEGIAVVFHDYRHPVYPQLFGGFTPYLAVVDMLFNCGSETRSIMRDGNVTRAEVLSAAAV